MRRSSWLESVDYEVSVVVTIEYAVYFYVFCYDRVVSIDYGGQVVVNELLSSNAAKKQFTSSVMVERSFRAPGINLSNLSTEMEEAEKKIRSVCWVIGLPGSQSTSYVDAAQVPKKRLLEAFVSCQAALLILISLKFTKYVQ